MRVKIEQIVSTGRGSCRDRHIYLVPEVGNAPGFGITPSHPFAWFSLYPEELEALSQPRVAAPGAWHRHIPSKEMENGQS